MIIKVINIDLNLVTLNFINYLFFLDLFLLKIVFSAINIRRVKMFKQILFIVLFLAASILNAQNNEFALQTIDSDLSNEDIIDALDQLGLMVYRFSCDLEPGYSVNFIVDKYENGKLKDTKTISRIGQTDCKLQKFTLYVIDDDNKVSFTTSYIGNSSWGSASSRKFKLYRQCYRVPWVFEDPVLKTNEMTPVLLYVLNKESVSLSPDLSPEEIISRNNMVFIVKYELVKIKQILEG